MCDDFIFLFYLEFFYNYCDFTVRDSTEVYAFIASLVCPYVVSTSSSASNSPVIPTLFGKYCSFIVFTLLTKSSLSP